jgi:hypothetical protein
LFSAITRGSSEKVGKDAAAGVADVGECVDGFVLAGLQHAGRDFLSLGAGVGAIAAPDFAVHDRRLERLLGPVIRGGNRRVQQELEPLLAMMIEMLGKRLVEFVAARLLGHVEQRRHAMFMGLEQIVLIEVASKIFVARVERGPKKVNDLLGESFGRSGLLFHQGPRAAGRMIGALLMSRVEKSIIRGAAIVRHRAGPVPTDDFGQGIGAALRVDDVARGAIVADPTVEPDEVPSDTPAGFVRRDVLGGFEVLFDLCVDRFELSAGPQHDLRTSAAREGDAKELSESVGDFPVGHAGTLVEINDGGLSVGAELALSGAGGVAGL